MKKPTKRRTQAEKKADRVKDFCVWFCGTLYACETLHAEALRLQKACQPGGVLHNVFDEAALMLVARQLENVLSALSSNPPAVSRPLKPFDHWPY